MRACLRPARTRRRPAPPEGLTETALPAPRLGLLHRGLGVQAQLRVSDPGDPFEREAERVADLLTRPASPEAAPVSETRPRPPGPLSGDLGPGRPLPDRERGLFEARLGHDLSAVRVHDDARAADTAARLGARAVAAGADVAFGSSEYAPSTDRGRRLLAHELVHVVQQGAARPRHPEAPALHLGRTAPLAQRAVRYDVLDWDATALGPPAPTNGPDPRTILIPATGQIAVSALVDVDGDAGDACSAHEIGTAQTAWVAWTIMEYRGQTAADGSVTVRHRSRMPMRDPSPSGTVWYDPANVRSAASCGTAVGVFHRDSPWHNPPKARNNGAVAGAPLVYLTSYRRGLHLVTYLTARDPAGAFLRRPLRFRYWNSLQSFDFTPQYPAPASAAPFLGAWPVSGGITVNIGGAGRGEVADAPYYATAGADFNAHFNDATNWSITERT